MSPPDTNLKKQEGRHKWPLIGMAIVVIFGIGIIVFWTGEEVATAPGTEDEVIVDEGISTASYLLDEALIEFGTAIDDRAYGRATDILETLELSPEAEGMWQQLSEMALAHGDLKIAERCAAALGDVSCLRYLHRVNKIAQSNEARARARARRIAERSPRS